MNGKLIIITGPSGVGKTSIAGEIFRRRPDIKKLVTYTTRPPRTNEVNGREYHFIDEIQFRKMLESREFMEHAKVYDYWYGNSRKDLEALLSTGATVQVVLNVQGAFTYEKIMPEATTIFIRAESPAVLRDRLLRRGKITAADLEKRSTEIETEMAAASEFDTEIENKEGELDRAVDLSLQAIKAAGAAVDTSKRLL